VRRKIYAERYNHVARTVDDSNFDTERTFPNVYHNGTIIVTSNFYNSLRRRPVGDNRYAGMLIHQKI
jgi:hypothetical protein